MTDAASGMDVLVLTPLGRDAPLIDKTLAAAGHRCRIVKRLAEIADAVPGDIGCAVVGEEALTPPAVEQLARALERQPSWSDVPLVLLSGNRRTHDGAAVLAKLGNVSVLDRPLQVRTLVSAVETALRARKRQYAARQEIVQRDQFLAMLGHELRNPLAAILFAADFLRRAGDEEAGPNRHAAIVHRQASHLARLVDDLLDVSRVTAGKVTLEKRPVDVADAVRKSLQTLQGRVQKRALVVSLTASEQPLFIDADPVRLEQVFGNLLTNAIKYSSAGGHIDVRVERIADTASVRVVDDGIGMEPSMVPRVFDLFAQAQTAIARTQGGMGIGLTLVKHLVDLHGGTVIARSEGLGRGSEFVVSFPLCDLPEETFRSSILPAAQAHGLRLVVVEDNADLGDLLREMLESVGHRVELATDGAEGVELISVVKPDCALVDIGLPGLNGYEVAREVRKRDRARPTLVAMTGYGQPEDRARALDAGFDAHMKKPVDLDALTKLLSKVQSRA